MAWTKTTRKQYRRDRLRYASDTTFEEWMLLSRLLPKQGRIGRPREVSLRAIIDAMDCATQATRHLGSGCC